MSHFHVKKCYISDVSNYNQMLVQMLWNNVTFKDNIKCVIIMYDEMLTNVIIMLHLMVTINVTLYVTIKCYGML